MREIPLSQGKVALVSDEDFDRVSRYKWTASKTKAGSWYAKGKPYSVGKKGKVPLVYLHRYIVDAPPDFLVDHEDGDGLNNQRSNLRVATFSQNCANRGSTGGVSKYKGVCYHRGANKWMAQISYERKHYYLGLFKNEVHAAEAYDQKALEVFGQFAQVNFPQMEKAA